LTIAAFTKAWLMLPDARLVKGGRDNEKVGRRWWKERRRQASKETYLTARAVER